jgi:hypothetical protein
MMVTEYFVHFGLDEISTFGKQAACRQVSSGPIADNHLHAAGERSPAATLMTFEVRGNSTP